MAASLRSIPIRPEDAGARQLVKEYARLLDEASDPIKAYGALGPKLLAALGELEATPAGRRPAAGPGTGELPAGVADLRERARTRAARAATLDATAP